MLTDIGYALRQLRRSWGFAFAAVLTLALGFGATAAIVSVADAVLLRPLPYPASDRLVMVQDELSKLGVHYNDVNYETFEAYQKNHAFDAASAFVEDECTLVGSGAAERVSVLSSTPGLLEMLGVRTASGRAFSNQDWTPERNDVAIISYSLFASRFAATANAVGRTIRLDDHLYTVVGVMAPNFNFALNGKGTDVWIPLPSMKDPRVWQFHMLARMRPGIGIAAAQASITETAKRVEETIRPYRGPNGEDGGYRARVFSLRNRLLGDYQTGSLLLLAASALLLLIACVNVSNLLLARAAGREKEIAIRRALGASAMRLQRQWTTEAAVLAIIGGAVGLAFAYGGIQLLKALSPAELPCNTSIGIDGRIVLFACLTSVIVCLVLSLAPAVSTLQAARSLRGPTRRYLANWLVTAEVAFAIVLLVSCGLLAKSFARLRQIDPGIRIEHLLTMQVQLSGPRYEAARQKGRFFSELQDRLANLPSVISASEINMLPVFTVGVDTRYGNPFSTDAHRFAPGAPTKQMAHTFVAGLDYFRTMGIALRKGRDFTSADVMDAPLVAIVNETLAREFFPNGDAVGRRILFGLPTPGGKDRWMTIVGVINDVRTGALDLPPFPQFYAPEMQQPETGNLFMVLRTQGDPSAISRAALSIARQLDPEQPVSAVTTMEQHVAGTLGQPRFRALLTSCFALLSLVLAAVGIYGVVAHGVTQRTKEIGIRSALGADAMRILGTVLTDGLKPIAVGAAIGIGGSVVLTRFLASMLYEVKPDDPITFVMSVALIAMVGIAACLVPAVAASRLDPVIALRNE